MNENFQSICSHMYELLQKFLYLTNIYKGKNAIESLSSIAKKIQQLIVNSIHWRLFTIGKHFTQLPTKICATQFDQILALALHLNLHPYRRLGVKQDLS